MNADLKVATRRLLQVGAVMRWLLFLGAAAFTWFVLARVAVHPDPVVAGSGVRPVPHAGSLAGFSAAP